MIDFYMYRKLDEELNTVEKLVGCDINELIRRLAAGWRLEPPKEPSKLSDLLNEFAK